MDSSEFDLSAEVSGRAMMALLESVNHEQIRHIIEDHHLDELDPAEWYPIIYWLEVFEAISENERTKTPNLVAIGMKYLTTALFPEQIDTLEDALMAVNDIYQHNHRGGYVGEFSVIAMGPGVVEVIDNTPYPQDFVFGMLYQTCHTYRSGKTAPIVERQPSDDEMQTYRITW